MKHTVIDSPADDLVTGDEPRLLHEFFERQVQLRPDHPAVECNGEALTYLALDRLADKIAAALRARELSPGSLVALYSEKSVRLFAAMLGVLKAGAAYVPIDPKTPLARIQSIIEDARITLVLGDEDLAQALAPQVSAEVLRIEAELIDAGFGGDMIAPPLLPVVVTPEDACYVIFTSGSTGRPKGVVIEHRNAVNFVRALRTVYRLTENDRIYQGFSLAFDASVDEIWAALSIGGTLVVPASDVARSIFDAAEFINRNRISYFSTVPSFLSMMMDDLPTVTLLVVGGEACAPELVDRWATPTRRMLNTYGPTEATVVATAADCVPGAAVTIGTALPGYEAYVLDEHLRPVAPGELGELYLGGQSIARGYLNQSELTAERFIPNTFATSRTERLYRTFDLVRLGHAGEFYFVGRADGQIKIRGFRVELSEIEAVLVEHPAIRAAVVNAIAFGALQELAAYVVLRSGHDFSRDSAAALLRKRVPDYMVPRYLDIVDELPAMTSGKVDRKLLPPPQTLLGAAERTLVAAATPVERIVVETFEEILKVPSISVEDDFFLDLGGHSLFAAQIATRLREKLGTAYVSVRDFYLHRNARTLAAHLQGLGTADSTAPAAADAPVPPTWFRYPCALLQLLGVLAYFGAVSAPLAIFIVLIIQVRSGEQDFWGAVDIATTVSFLIWPTWLALSIAVKWLIIGRYKPGRYRVWGFYYFRWWLVNRFQALGWSEMFVGTPLMSLYYRAMGATVGRNCTIGTPICTAFDLVSIGDNSSIGSDTHMLGYRVEDGWLILGNVTIGSECYVGTHCCLSLNTVMGDRARLDDMSHLPDGAVVAAGEGMRGSPAEPADVDLQTLDLQTPDRASKPRRGAGFLFGVFHLMLIYAMGYILIMSMLPGIALIAAALYFGSTGLGILATFAAVPLSTACYLILVLTVKWVAIGRIAPGTYALHSAGYLRYWFLNYLLNNARNIALAVYATLFLPKFLKLLGAKIGRGAEISTAMHIMPDLLEIGAGSFLADACIVGGHKIHRGHLELRANNIGARSFVGNSALVPAGIDVGSDSLIGVMSTPPAGIARTPDGKRWLGSPSFELPNTQQVSCFSTAQTFEPGAGLVLGRVLVECLKFLLPGFVAAGSLVLFCLVIASAYQRMPLWAVAAAAPVTALALSFLSIGAAALIKTVLVGRFKPTVKPLWCSFVWLNEVVNAVYESIAPAALGPLMGTPFISPCLRLMGCRIGKWVFLETTLFSEFDLVEIGDHAGLNLGSTIQTHLFEDRVMKSGHLKIGAGCSVGNMAVVLYDTEMKRGSSIGSLSVLMKGEVLPEFTRWIGIPTRPMACAVRPVRAVADPANISGAKISGVKIAGAARGSKPTTRRRYVPNEWLNSSATLRLPPKPPLAIAWGRATERARWRNAGVEKQTIGSRL
jgi:non-ribosomal peptide synthetase-like protein